MKLASSPKKLAPRAFLLVVCLTACTRVVSWFAPNARAIANFSVNNEGSHIQVDHSAWSALLAGAVDVRSDGTTSVRYGDINTEALSAYLRTLEKIDPGTLARSEQMAYWLNAYNAATVLAVARNPAVASIKDIPNVWKTPVLTVAGLALTLDQIEHGILRPIFGDPRVHYGLNCASRGCPNLLPRAFSGAAVDSELDAAARGFVNGPQGARIVDGELVVSSIYVWFLPDFGGSEAAVVEHLRAFASHDLARALEGRSGFDDDNYDWSLNGVAR